MSAVTATHTEYGVQYKPLGETELAVLACEDAAAVDETIADLADEGVTVLVPVSREVPEWHLAPEGLPAAVRALAELRHGDELDDSTAAARLAGLFGDGARHLAQQWLDLVDAVAKLDGIEHNRIDWNMVDPDLQSYDQLEQHYEQLVIDAAAAVIAAAGGGR